MKKNKLTMIGLFGAIAAMMALTSCSQQELVQDSVQQTDGDMTVSVSKQDFVPVDAATRATTTVAGATTLEAGDQIGVFAVNTAGQLLKVNEPYTLQSDGTWKNASGDTKIKDTPHCTYFAYYPYQTKFDVTAYCSPSTITTAEAFFAGLISSWDPGIDFSTPAKYAAGDLMVAKGTVTDYACTFALAHKMVLVEFDYPQTRTYYNGSAYDQYTFGTYTPYNIDNGKYRLLIKPATNYALWGQVNSTSSPYTSKLSTWSVYTGTSLAANSFIVYKNSAGTAANLTPVYATSPAVGDIYYSDGTYSSTYNSSKTAIGVVVSTNGTYCESGKGYGHGLVMALNDAGTSIAWKTTNADAGLTKCSTYTTLYHDVSGLTNQTTVGTSSTFPAFNAAYNYLSTAHPTGSSSWFLPSAGQWWDAMEKANTKKDGSSLTIAGYHDSTNGAGNWVSGDYKALTALNSLMSNYSGLTYTAIGDHLYWTGSEWGTTNACYLVFNSSNGLLFGDRSKTYTYYVRPFLAF